METPLVASKARAARCGILFTARRFFFLGASQCGPIGAAIWPGLLISLAMTGILREAGTIDHSNDINWPPSVKFGPLLLWVCAITVSSLIVALITHW